MLTATFENAYQFGEIYLLHDSAILFLRIYPRDMEADVHKDTYVKMLIAPLLTTD